MYFEKKKIAIIGTVGLPANYGGFETLTEHLVECLGSTYDMTVYCSGKKYQQSKRAKTFKGAKLKYLPFDANGIQSIIYDSLSILHAVLYADVLLILGVAGAWLLPFVRLFTKKKIIISIDGIEWKRGKWNILAKWYLFWAENLAVKYSHIDISDNEAIQDYTAARYGTLSRIIEYGSDHVLKVKKTPEAEIKYPFLNHFYAFKVCRIEPENNVHIILEAFAQLKNIHLVVVGNWNKSTYGLDLKEQYQDYANITILDPIYEQEKLDILRSNASLYIHGHSAGGTNPSLVEAMYLELPIIAFEVAYNKVTTENKALYFKDIEDLKYKIKNISMSTLKNMAYQMYQIAEKRYKWSLIAQKYSFLIQEVLTIKDKSLVETEITRLNYSDLLDLEISHLKIMKGI